MAEGQRTVAELLALAQEEAKRIREPETLASKAEATWTFAAQLIQQGNTRFCDEAVQLLVKPHDLAIYQGAEAVYETGIRRLRRQTKSHPGTATLRA